MTEIILGVIAAVSTLISGWLAFRQSKIQTEKNAEKEIIEAVLERVDKLETRQDTLYDKIYAIGQKADEERERLNAAHEARLEQVRKEMRRLIDDSNLELATWRDKYFTLINDYQKLKMEYATLEIKFDAVQKELERLQVMYAAKMANPRDTHRDIADTP